MLSSSHSVHDLLGVRSRQNKQNFLDSHSHANNYQRSITGAGDAGGKSVNMINRISGESSSFCTLERDRKIAQLMDAFRSRAHIEFLKSDQSNKVVGVPCSYLEDNTDSLLSVDNLSSANLIDHKDYIYAEGGKADTYAFSNNSSNDNRGSSNSSDSNSGSDGDATGFFFDSAPKRAYLEDLKPFGSVFTAKNFTIQLTKAALLPTQAMVMDYNFHIIRELEREQEILSVQAEAKMARRMRRSKDNSSVSDLLLHVDSDPQQEPEPEPLPPFDWTQSFEKHFPLFYSAAPRHLTTSVLRRTLEELAVIYFSEKTADRLIKDLGKSTLRKLAKYHSNRLYACVRVFFTSVWSNALFNASLFLYDISMAPFVSALIEDIPAPTVSAWRDRKSLSRIDVSSVVNRIQAKFTFAFEHPFQIVQFCVNKGCFYVVSLVSSAFGYSAGTYCFGPKYGGPIVSMLSELLCSYAYNSVVSAFE